MTVPEKTTTGRGVTGSEDTELMRMAVFKLEETARRLHSLSQRTESQTLRDRLRLLARQNEDQARRARTMALLAAEPEFESAAPVQLRRGGSLTKVTSGRRSA